MTLRKEIEPLIIEASRLSRGTIIQMMTEVEIMIDVYVAELFTKDPDKIEQLICNTFARITLENKRQMFCFYVDRYNPEFKSSHPKYAKDLKDIIEKRNKYAHNPVDFSNEAIEKYKNETTYYLIKTRYSKRAKVEKITISQKVFNDLENQIRYYLEALKKLTKTHLPL
jgi:hypothetical protein